MVNGVVADAIVVGPSFTASTYLNYYVAVALSQFAGLTFNPVDGLASHW
jgi:hypothetical protein